LVVAALYNGSAACRRHSINIDGRRRHAQIIIKRAFPVFPCAIPRKRRPIKTLWLRTEITPSVTKHANKLFRLVSYFSRALFKTFSCSRLKRSEAGETPHNVLFCSAQCIIESFICIIEFLKCKPP
jgi:hypothetical protein